MTFDMYPAEDDLLTITWMETALWALGVLRGPFASELYGIEDRVFVRFAVQDDETAVNETLCPVGPYHHTLSLLGKEGASPLSLAATVLARLGEGEHGVLQVLAAPRVPPPNSRTHQRNRKKL